MHPWLWRETYDIQIVEEQSANFLIDEAMEITETWLQKRSDIDAIAAQSDAMAMGAAKACKDAGVELLIGGRDCTSDMRTALKEGTTYCTVHQGSPESRDFVRWRRCAGSLLYH